MFLYFGIMLPITIVALICGGFSAYNNKQSKLRASDYNKLSRGAKRFLGAEDPNSDTGYYGNMKPFDVYSSYSAINIPLDSGVSGRIRELAEKDYKQFKKDIEEGFNSDTVNMVKLKSTLVNVEKLKEFSQHYNISLNEITSEEWNMIFDRYFYFLNKFRAEDVKMTSNLSHVIEQNEKKFKQIGYVSDAHNELQGLLTKTEREAEVWQNEFFKLEGSSSQQLVS